MGPLAADLRIGHHHVSLGGLNAVRSMLPLLPLARGIWEFVIASLGGQVTGWVRRRWRLAKFSTPCAGLALSRDEPSDTDCATRWLNSLLEQQHHSRSFEILVNPHTTLVGQG